ncbi:MAG: hypothetical protein AAF721_38615 [Myxococcota bacterium]
MRLGGCLGYAACVALGACEAPDDAVVPAPDYDAFERDIFPLLLRDCGFSACHGREERPFRLYGPYRLRLDSQTAADDPVTAEELWLSYQRTRSMLVAADLEDAPLLRKPLPGGGHDGIEEAGGAVYESDRDPSFVLLRRWAEGDLEYGP